MLLFIDIYTYICIYIVYIIYSNINFFYKENTNFNYVRYFSLKFYVYVTIYTNHVKLRELNLYKICEISYRSYDDHIEYKLKSQKLKASNVKLLLFKLLLLILYCWINNMSCMLELLSFCARYPITLIETGFQSECIRGLIIM